MNVYEKNARAKKVASIVRALDRSKNSAGLDDGGLYNLIISWTPTDWRRICQAAGINEPSETTISEVITALRQRII